MIIIDAIAEQIIQSVTSAIWQRPDFDRLREPIEATLSSQSFKDLTLTALKAVQEKMVENNDLPEFFTEDVIGSPRAQRYLADYLISNNEQAIDQLIENFSRHFSKDTGYTRTKLILYLRQLRNILVKSQFEPILAANDRESMIIAIREVDDVLSEISTKIDRMEGVIGQIIPIPKPEISLDDSQKQELISQYRQSILQDTEFVSLKGIPLPISRSGQRLAPSVPLDRIYIRIQAIEQHQKFQVEQSETRAIKNEAIRRSYAGVNTSSTSGLSSSDPLTIAVVLGEHFYRRGEVHNFLERREPVDPATVLENHEHLTVLGAPGSGKSSLLRYISRDVVSSDEQHVPILVSLRDFSTALAENQKLSLREFSLDQIRTGNASLRSVLTEIINKGNVIWLLDALDEAHTLKESIATQIRTLPGKVVVTSRPNGYISLAGFEHYEILPLSIDDIQEFIRNWYMILGEERGWKANDVTDRINRLLDFIEANEQIKAIVRNPLILTFLAVSAQDDSQYTLPSHRAYLYRTFITELLNNWEIDKDQEETKDDTFRIAHLSGEAARNITLNGMRALGWHLHDSYFGLDRERIPSREDLVAYLTDLWNEDHGDHAKRVSEEVIDFWERAGVIDAWTIDNEKYLAFRHMTFQEFMVAETLVQNWLESPEPAWDYIHRHQHHYAWREPIALFAGLLDAQQLNEFLKKMIDAAKHFSTSTEFEYDSPIEAIQSVAQNEIRLAIMLIAENSPKISSDLLKSITTPVQKLLRTQIPALSMAIAEEAASIRSGNASTIFTDIFINDMKQGKWEHSPYRGNIPSSTAALLKEAEDGLLSEVRVEAIVQLAKELEENYWQIAIASHYQNPNQNIAEYFIRFLDENHQEDGYEIDDTRIRIAHYLLMNGHSTSKAIGILRRQINLDLGLRNSLTKRSVFSLGHSFKSRQLTAEDALSAIEAIARIQLIYEGSLPQESLVAFHAALAPEQSPEVVEIVTKRLLGIIDNDKRSPIHHQDGQQILVRVITDFEVSKEVYSVFNIALDNSNEKSGYDTGIILLSVLENDKINPELFTLYLKSLDLLVASDVEQMIKLLSKAIIENRVSDDMLKQLSPFWAKAFDDDLYLRRPDTIDHIVRTHVYLIERGILHFQLSYEELLPPSGITYDEYDWELVVPEYFKRFWFYIEHWAAAGILPNLERILLQECIRTSDEYYKEKTLSVLANAIHSGKGIPESIPLFVEYIKYDDPSIRMTAINGLASAIQQNRTSSDNVVLIIAAIKDEDKDVSGAAEKAISSIVNPNPIIEKAKPLKVDPKEVFNKLKSASGYDVVRVLRQLKGVLASSGFHNPNQIEYLMNLLSDSINEYDQAEQDMKTLQGQEHEQARRASIRGFDQIIWIVAILNTTVMNGYGTYQIISILVQTIQDIHLPRELVKEVWESVSESGLASEFIENICVYCQRHMHSAYYPDNEKAFVALSVACKNSEARTKTLPTLIEIVKSGGSSALQHIAEIIGDNQITSDAIVETALNELHNDPERQELGLIIGRIAEYKIIPLATLNEIFTLMREQPLLDQVDYLKGFGYVIRNPSCPDNIRAFSLSILISYFATYVDSHFDRIIDATLSALTDAELIGENELRQLAYLLNTDYMENRDDWEQRASNLSSIFAKSTMTNKKRLIDSLYFALKGGISVFSREHRKQLAYFFGFIDSRESRDVLLFVLSLSNIDRHFFNSAIGAIYGLAHLGRIHPEWQEQIIVALLDAVTKYSVDPENNKEYSSIPAGRDQLLQTTIYALQIMQATSKEAESLLVISLSDSKPNIQAAAADVLGKLGYTNEIILAALAQRLSDPQLLVRNAAWTSLNHLLRQGYIYSTQ